MIIGNKHSCRWVYLGRFIFLVLISYLTPVHAGENKGIVYFNATLIDPSSKTRIEEAWLQVADGKIVDLGKGEKPDADGMVDLKGGFVVPGLIDAHLHLTAGPLEVKLDGATPSVSMASVNRVTRFHAQAALASGITSAFNPAGDPVANQRYKERQRSGDWRGPALVYAGYTFDPVPIIGGSVYPRNKAEWQKEVARQKAADVSHIKLYTGLTAEEVALGIGVAKAAGLKTIGHLNNVSWQFAVDNGIDALSHALPTSPALLPDTARDTYIESLNPASAKFMYQWFEQVDYQSPEMQRLFSDLAAEKVQVDLTLLVNELMYFHPEYLKKPKLEAWEMHPRLIDTWLTNLGASMHDWTEEDYARAQAVFPKVLELLRHLHEHEVPLRIGADSYSGGSAFWRELELHQLAGLDSWEILTMATTSAAESLGWPQKGRLSPNYEADFVVLAEDPIADISAVHTVQQVVQAGKHYQVKALRNELKCWAQRDGEDVSGCVSAAH